MRRKILSVGAIGVVIGVLLSATVVFAGNLNPTVGPADPSSQMYTLQHIWDRINNGAAATKMSAFTEPSTGPGSTMKTLDDLYTLASERSRPAKTGETINFGAGTDGALQRGVAWPNPRFTDNGNGTVTDNLTGLIWLKNASCGGTKDWVNALTFANSLYDGWTGDGSGGDCGLSDDSTAGDWRLPNVGEQHSLIDYGMHSPALPSDHPFTGVQNFYWMSTTIVWNTSYAWRVFLNEGVVYHDHKLSTHYVWPVRGGQ